MANSQQCSIEFQPGSECLTTYTPLLGTEYFEDLPADDREILMWGTGLSIINVKLTTCPHHKHVYLKCYATKVTQCCNPFNAHKKARKGIYRSFSNLHFQLILNNL